MEVESATDGVQIGGVCDARFEGVRAAFRENFAARGELGAAVTVSLDGRPVVDLFGGFADRARTCRWGPGTLVNVFSVGKGMVALTLCLLVDRYGLDLDAPVARYWPEFAAADKGEVSVRELAGHRAGLPAIRAELPAGAMYDWEGMTDRLAAERPWWPPGSAHGYHVNTYGFMLGELVRRLDGRSFGRFFREEVAARLGAEVAFGLGPEWDARIAESQLPSGPIQMPAEDPERRLLLQRTYANPQGHSGNGTVNTRAWRAAEIPSTNGHGNARGIARVYAALACDGTLDGIELVRPETLREASAEVSVGHDVVLDRPTRFGLGFQLTSPARPLGPNPGTFGHFGAGGSLGFADPDARLAFGYCLNLPGPRWQNPRTLALIDATYASL